MFGFIKKRILKSIINDVIKSIPVLTAKARQYLEEHKDEIIDKVKESIKSTILKIVKEKL